jgi:hypothetical protein
MKSSPFVINPAPRAAWDRVGDKVEAGAKKMDKKLQGSL